MSDKANFADRNRVDYQKKIGQQYRTSYKKVDKEYYIVGNECNMVEKEIIFVRKRKKHVSEDTNGIYQFPYYKNKKMKTKLKVNL